ncbi:MAG: ATP-binding protein, partial [Chloroflexota bacterium]|nr:ATP-binding protein [Chloroflexota bacterium]
MALNRTRARGYLQKFEFENLLIEIGWNSVPQAAPRAIGDTGYQYRLISDPVFEVFPANPSANSLPNARLQAQIHQQIEQISLENLIVFLDNDKKRAQSLWYWVKREDGKKRPRRHYYFKGQPGDLFLSKIANMVIEMDDLPESGAFPVTERARRFADSFDILPVTKRFYNEFSGLRLDFIDLIEGITSDTDRFWYASVLLNRLMFIYFLQKKDFIQNNGNYLDDKLEQSRSRGPDRYYREFLDALFFEGFAKPEHERGESARMLLGPIPYLNGGLFIRHKLELDYGAIHIPDSAFENVLRLFGRYSWHLDDTPGARDNEINPDVLGYIFEKYINQKAFGAYYTRAEITEYLCERGIHSVLLQKVNENNIRQFDDWRDVLTRLDANLCNTLLFQILPALSILDPACGSGAFLVAAMKNLLDVYGAVFGKIEVLNDHYLSSELAKIRRNHPSLNYYIRKKIITDNLYGVDIMDEATEIARLRLFLALVGAAQKLDDLEPLPNIDFNIMAGNSLIGLLKVDDRRFDDAKDMADQSQQDMMQPVKARDYRRALAEKNRLIALYRDTDSDYSDHLQGLRGRINAQRAAANDSLNDILLDDFRALKIQYEGAQLKGKAKKRPLAIEDIEALSPFHWGYEFDQIIETRGGFDVIITNPPWQDVKIVEKTFFQQFDPTITKNKIDKRELRKRMAELLQSSNVCNQWLAYQSEVSLNKAYFKKAALFANQRKGKLNLYALFIEQCKNLLRKGGSCGIVVPDGIYNLKGRQLLRQMLFEETEITGLFGFENRRAIFEDVHKSFKFIVLTFKNGGRTQRFPAAFMRQEVGELESFPADDSLRISIDLIHRASPDTLSITEFKTSKDIEILEKMLNHPLLGDDVDNTWKTTFRYEFDQGKVSSILQDEASENSIPLY